MNPSLRPKSFRIRDKFAPPPPSPLPAVRTLENSELFKDPRDAALRAVVAVQRMLDIGAALDIVHEP